ncbi:MAG TPA: carboxymuconolactone decarboxylase family protein [Candidatus Tumulicola sp.]|nr:carboxymuconolactone decarboxylase family protein [Candidatus Tumulicola sp.]
MTENSAVGEVRDAGRWARLLDVLQELDPQWAELYARVAIDPWINGALSAKEVQLVCVGLSAAVTNMDEAALRRHVRAALHAGASREEILEVLKMAAILSLHSMSLGAPILIEEALVAGKAVNARTGTDVATPASDKMKAIGQWNDAWDSFATLDPVWTDRFIAAGSAFYTDGVLTPRFVELISIAFDAAITHMYAPGTRRHMKAALALGASVEQILDVLKICVSQGANALDRAVPVLQEEAEAFDAGAETDFVTVLDEAELPMGTATTVEVRGRRIALFNVNGRVYATDDSCPHAGSSLGWGVLEGKTVKCRAHGLRFDVTSGSIAGGSGLCVTTYPAKVDDGKISVALV